jgi:hypothetical protein
MRLVLVIALLLIAPGARAEDGETAWNRACAECHRNAARIAARYADMYPADRRTALDDFLRSHHAPEEATRAAIIAWLETKLPRR